MLLSRLPLPQHHTHFLQHFVWQTALEYLQNVNHDVPLGEHEIDGRNIYASVSTIKTQSREKSFFEAHREYIDIHYCLEGGEIIEWAPVDSLTPTMEFDTVKDYCLYAPPSVATQLHMTPGMFAIFFPEDAHIPKLHGGTHTTVKKVVIKIKTSLL